LRVGIIGAQGSGRRTVFEALTQVFAAPGHTGESRIGTIAVPDDRLDALSELYKPKKTTPAQVQYFLPAVRGQDDDRNQDDGMYAQVRECDALIAVIPNFNGMGHDRAALERNVRKLDEDMVFADLVVAEKRVERIQLERQRGRRFDAQELAALRACCENLERGVPLRRLPELASSPYLRSYSFLSAKPLLLLLNNPDDDGHAPDVGEPSEHERRAVIRGRLEHELAQMPGEEAAEFSQEYGLTESATRRVIRESYELLGLASFFTVGPDEVRAWTIRRGTHAVHAAGEIHSDIARGFIRAEVVAYDDLMESGSHHEARKRGLVRLEKKTYPVQDGDIIDVAFNV
jgi:GTP-binding protein YchF